MHRAATEDDLDGVCAMIKAGANVNAQDYAGKYNIQHKFSFIKISESILFNWRFINTRFHFFQWNSGVQLQTGIIVSVDVNFPARL